VSPLTGASSKLIADSLVFPRWDVIAILFSVFLLTYVYLEARANYYRGSILVFR
jgi:Ca2+:H+ antiporter